jgi:hypothetical protein
LAHQPDGASAQASGHLVEVVLRNLFHREVELQILDGAQDQRLFALQGGARLADDERRRFGRARHHERGKRQIGSQCHEARRHDRQTERHDRCGRLPRRDQNDRRR